MKKNIPTLNLKIGILCFCLLFSFKQLSAQTMFNILNNLVQCIHKGELEKAQEYAGEAMSFINAGKSEYPTDTADAYLAKALVYIKLLQLEEATPYITQSFEAYQKIKNKEKEPFYMFAVISMAAVNIYKHEYGKAIPVLQTYADTLERQIERKDLSPLPLTGLQIFYPTKEPGRKLPNSSEEATLPLILNILSGHYLSIGDIQNAQFINKKAISFAKEWKETNPMLYSQCLIYALIIMSKTEDFSSADSLINETLSYNKLMANKVQINKDVIPLMLTNYSTIANIYNRLGNPQRSIDVLQEELDFYEEKKVNNLAIKTQIYNDMSVSYILLGNYTRAKRFVIEGIAMAKSHFSDKSLDYYRYYYNLPLFYAKMGNNTASKMEFEKLITLQEKNKDTNSKIYFESLSNYIILCDQMSFTNIADSTEKRLLALIEPVKNIYPEMYYEHLGMQGVRLSRKGDSIRSLFPYDNTLKTSNIKT